MELILESNKPHNVRSIELMLESIELMLASNNLC